MTNTIGHQHTEETPHQAVSTRRHWETHVEAQVPVAPPRRSLLMFQDGVMWVEAPAAFTKETDDKGFPLVFSVGSFRAGALCGVARFSLIV